MLKTQIKPRYKDSSVKNINSGIYKMLEESIKKREPPCLYIFGDTGVGKTYIAYAIYNLVTEHGLPCVVVRGLDIVEAIKGTFTGLPHYESPQYESTVEMIQFLKDLSEYKGLLIIDDVGVEKSSEAVIVKMFQIINDRYEWMYPTTYTSNLDLNELKEKVGDRIVGRIVEDCEIIKLEGNNKRNE